MILKLAGPSRLAIYWRVPLRTSFLFRNSFEHSKRWSSTAESSATTNATPEAPPFEETLPPSALSLLTQEYPLIPEFLAPTQSHLLTLTLQPYLNFKTD